mgnify:CR=1 FL=1
MSNPLIAIFQIIVFIFSVMAHEVSHGFAALRLGDTTAKDAGRLTFNPLVHLDPFGSFLLPLMLYFISGGSMVFGWAKPVPYDPSRLQNPNKAAGLIAAAGPISNLVIAAIFGLLIRLSIFFGIGNGTIILLFNIIVLVNIFLAIFNLVPLPPLDGSKILFAFLPSSYYNLRVWLERYGFMLLIFFIFFGFQFITPFIGIIYRLFVGSSGIL